MSNRIILPQVLEIGGGAINKLTNILASFSLQRPCIISDPVMLQLGYVGRIQQLLSGLTINCPVFSDTIPEPTDRSIQPAVDFVKQGNFDCLIALGGGSAIDSAKAIGVLASLGGAMRDYKVPCDVSHSGLPVIAIPTTAGTGSETTLFTIITDASNDEKMLCRGRGFMPVAAIVDYQLTLSLPPRITADTGIDALTHAIEAYVSQKANAFSDQQALAAMKLLAPNLRCAYRQADNLAAREAMMLGATLAGIAFSNASVALVHGMSRPIGAHFHVPHGLSNAMLLPAITQFSQASAPQRYADCARAMGIATANDNDEQANALLLQELTALNHDLQVPSLAQFGVKQADYLALLPLMAEQANASGSPANNPRVPSLEEMIGLYDSLWV